MRRVSRPFPPIRLPHRWRPLLGIVLIVIDLAYRLERLPSDAESLVNDGGGQGEAGLCGVAVGGPGVVTVNGVLGSAIRRGGRGGRGVQGVASHIFEDAVQERGEGGDFAGAEERERVRLDRRGPVCVVRVEGVEEGFLDSVKC